MTNGFPCPNPACTHVFAPQAVKGASALVCPRCGTRFQFRSGVESTPPPGAARPRPTAPPVATPVVPVAIPVTPPGELAAAPFIAPEALPSPLVRRLRRGRRSIAQSLVGIMVLLVAVATGAFGVVWVLKHTSNDEEASGGLTSPFNYQYTSPGSEWKQDKKTRTALGANFVLARREPNAWLAVFAKDYKSRSPRDAELHDQLVKWLDKYFIGLEYELKPDEKLSDERARRIEFQGEADNVLMNGECLMLTRRGYGYWLVTWAPAERHDMAAEEWPSVRGGFHFLPGRDGWLQKKPRLVAVEGEKAAYRLAYPEGVWEKQSLDGLDPKADLLLRGFDPREDKEGKVASAAGTMTVLKLPRAEGSPKAAATGARDYYLAKQKEGGFPETRIEVVSDKNGPADGPADIGAARGHLARLRVTNSESRVQYVELATLLLPDGVLVFQSECLWSRRDYWRQEFAPLRATLKLGN